MIEDNSFVPQSAYSEARQFVFSQYARVGALRAETTGRDECGCSQSAALALGAEDMGFLVGRWIGVHVDQFVHSDSAQTKNVKARAHLRK